MTRTGHDSEPNPNPVTSNPTERAARRSWRRGRRVRRLRII